jgi:PAS domain S-box-containing protein
MPQPSELSNQYPFLAGGGEMGELTRTHDWSATSAGAPGQWPQSLRTLVAMMLRSHIPTLLLWGQELATFYNDAFLPSLDNNGKHPSSLGQPAEQSWADAWSVVGPVLHNIMGGGEAVSLDNQNTPLYRDGAMEYAYWTYNFGPVTDDNGSVNGVLVTCFATTSAAENLTQLTQTNTAPQQPIQQDNVLRQEERATQQQLEQSQRELLDLFEESPVGIATISADENLTFRYANSFYGELVGRKPEAIVDKPLLEALPELAGQGFDDLLRTVTATGTPFIAKEVAVNLVRHNQLETIYVDLTYQPRRGATGTISGILVVATDVTQQVLSRRQVEESETKLLGVIAAAPAGIGLFIGRDLVIEHPNQTFIDIVGKGSGVDGLPLREAMPELLTEGQPFLTILDDVFTTGVPFISPASLVKIVQNGVLNDNYYNISYTPLRDATGQIYGILDIAIDVTEQVKAQQALAENETRFRSLIEEAPVATMLMTGQNHVIELANQQMIDMLGKGPSIIGKSAIDSVPELANQTYLNLLDNVFTSGEIYRASAMPGQLVNDGVATNHYFDFTYKPLRDTTGAVYGILAMAVDITQQVLAHQKLAESTTALRNAVELAELGNFSVDVATNLLTVSPRVADWFGFDSLVADATAFINGVGESDREYVQTSLYNTLLPGSGGRYDVVHSVVNAKTGHQIIIHALGRLYVDAAGNPTKIEGTAQDITAEREQKMLLEQQVQQRTEELAATNEELAVTNEELAATNEELATNNEEYAAINEELEETNGLLMRSNDNLQKFAYVASHDLQEPLRKIQQFGDLLRNQYGAQLGDGMDYLERMQSAASRMSTLIKDLLTFSRISTQRDENKPLDLNKVVSATMATLELVIEETGAQITVEPLPTISGDALQLGQLFQNLLSNALKFRRAGIRPVISVGTALVSASDLPPLVKPPQAASHYYRIGVTDNGIGFEEKYLDRIFQVFQRLHGRNEFAGTGIGLAICEKVVTNHGGAIVAASQPGQGATFSVYLPR